MKMKLLSLLISFFVIVGLNSFCWCQFSKDSIKTKYVVVIVVDGPRFSETFGDTSCQYIPKMGKLLTKEGTLFTNFKNNGSTYTNAGHTAISTGFYQKVNNGRGSFPKKPSFFQYYLKGSGADKSSAWLIASKGKLEILSNTSDKKWWNSYLPMSYSGMNGNSNDYVNDARTFQKVIEVINEDHPTLMLVNFLAPDAAAHQNNWNGYINGLLQDDAYVYEIWRHIQRDSLMKDKTTLFVTNDHGRHIDGRKEGFKEHGDACVGCRHISLLVLGPDTKVNEVITEASEIIDISKTIAFLLNFEMPTSKGRILYELFQQH